MSAYVGLPAYLHDLVTEIQSAVAAERKVASRGVPFRLLRAAREGGISTFILESDSAALDATMEEARTLKWAGAKPGKAEIITIDVEKHQIHAFTDNPLPMAGQTVWIDSPEFLKPLLELWSSESPVRSAFAWHSGLGEDVFNSDLVPEASTVTTLRRMQREAFRLNRP